jgi:hypothetical protein
MMPLNNVADIELLTLLRQARDLLDRAIELRSSARSKESRTAQKSTGTGTAPVSIDFSMPIRPFIKAHSAGMSGAQKFTLLVAYLTKGNEKSTVSLATIEAEWNRMTNLLGGKFNGAHSGRARDNDLRAGSGNLHRAISGVSA